MFSSPVPSSVARDQMGSWVFFFVLCIASMAGCGTEEPEVKEPVLPTGGVLLTVVAPDLWPPAEGQRVYVLRGVAGDIGSKTAEYSTVPTPLRVVPHQDVAAWIGLEVRDAKDVLIAAGRTPALIIDSDAPDREVTIFLAPRGAAHTVRDADGVAVALTARVGSTATALPDGSVIIAGGGTPATSGAPCMGGAPSGLDASVRQLDPLTHKLSVIAKLSKSRAFHAAVALPGNRVAFLGGYVGGAPGTSVEILSANQAMVKAAPFGLSQARARHCVVRLGGRLLVVGGDGPGGATAELWDPGTGTVATVNLIGARRRPSCDVVVDPATGDELIFVMGGDTGSTLDAGVSSDLALKVVGSTLTLFATLPMTNQALRYESIAATHAPLGILRLGGLASDGGGAARVDWLQLPGVGYASLGTLSEARGCGATGVVGRALLVAGGISGSGESAALDLIDLVDRKPMAMALPAARAGGWVAPLSSGAALIGGGTADGLVTTLP